MLLALFLGAALLACGQRLVEDCAELLVGVVGLRLVHFGSRVVLGLLRDVGLVEQAGRLLGRTCGQLGGEAVQKSGFGVAVTIAVVVVAGRKKRRARGEQSESKR